MKHILVALLLAACSLSHAQTSAAKKELITKVLQLQRPAVEAQSRAMADQPAVQLMQRAVSVIQTRVAPDKREALAKEIQADLRKYSEEAVPMVRERAVRLMPTTLGAVLDTQFSEAELKQLIATLESPVFRKYQEHNGEMFKAMQEKLVPEVRPELEPKIKALEQGIGKKLEAAITASPAGSSGGTKP